MDRTFRGVVSGVIAGLVMNAWSFFAYDVLNFSTLRFVDWTGIMIYGYPPANAIQTLFALMLHMFWVAALGVGFAFIVPYLTSTGIILKGIGYSLLIAFVSFSLTTLYQVPYLAKTPFWTVVSNFIGVLIWGFILAYVFRWLDEKTAEPQAGFQPQIEKLHLKLRRFSASPAPARKKSSRTRVKLRKPVKVKSKE